MWIRFKRVRTRPVAEAWKEFLMTEGVAARVVRDVDASSKNAVSYGVYVPNTKRHIAEEALRQL